MTHYKILTDELAKELRELAARHTALRDASVENGVRFEVVISSESRDRHDEVIKQDGLDVRNYLRNPIVLWAHKSSEPPIGFATKIRREGDKTIAEGYFVPEEVNPFAGQIARLYEMGVVRAASVGIVVREYDENTKTITKSELVEFSFVPVPANPQALAVARRGGVSDAVLAKALVFEDEAQKAAVAPHTTPTAPEDRPWDKNRAIASVRKWASRDGSGEKDTIDWTKYRKAFAWYDENDQENFASYKLPHHEVIDGKLVVVWNGVRAAMAALFGARGGVDIPDDEWDGVYQHLARHYKQFDKEPPEPKDKEAIAELLKAVVEDDTDDEQEQEQETQEETQQEEKKQDAPLATRVGGILAQMQTELDGVVKARVQEVVDLVKAFETSDAKHLSEAELKMVEETLESTARILKQMRAKVSEPTPDGGDTADGEKDDEAARFLEEVVRAINKATARALQRANEQKRLQD